MALSGRPSRARCPSASGEVQNSRSHSWSVSRRLISSGIVLSNERSPASTWASGTPSFAPASAAPTVEFTSPYSTVSAGGFAWYSRSMPTSTSAVCEACVPEPTPRFTSGFGSPSWTKNTSDIRSS